MVPLKDLACLMDNQTDKCLECIGAVLGQNLKRNPKCRQISFKHIMQNVMVNVHQVRIAHIIA